MTAPRRNSLDITPQPPTSLSLLSSLTPTFESAVAVRSSFYPRRKRFLEIRATVILIHQRQPNQSTNLQFVLRAIPLTSSISITTNKYKPSVKIANLKITFTTFQLRDQFVNTTNAITTLPRDTYIPIRRIGRGASGMVYVAIRTRDGKKLAVKAIPRHEAFHSDSAVNNLAMERLTLGASFKSPGLIHLLHAFTTPKALCLVTELAEYGDLHHILKRLPKQKFDQNIAKTLFVDMLQALMDLHQLGFLYRDMKLANVVVTSSGHAKLVDFGLAKRVPIEIINNNGISSAESGEETDFDDENGSPSIRILTRLQSFVGTRHYMSPEHHETGKKRAYGAPADVWALGVCLYLMVTGKYPFGMDVRDSDHTGLALSIRHDDLYLPNELSEELKDLLQQLLNREALERIDLDQIRYHSWLKNINWQDTRNKNRVDAMQVDVLSFFQKHNIPTVMETELTDSETEKSVEDILSTVSEITTDGLVGGMKMKNKITTKKKTRQTKQADMKAGFEKWKRKISMAHEDVWSSKEISNRQEILGFEFVDHSLERSRRQVVGSASARL